MRRIKLGLPKGSLNTPGRGNTESLFLDAGYEIKGYTPTRESDRGLRIANDPEIDLYLTRPQSAPSELSRGLLDIAVIGADWVREETLDRASDITFLADLEYGGARLVAAVPKEHPADDLTAFSRPRPSGLAPSSVTPSTSTSPGRTSSRTPATRSASARSLPWSWCGASPRGRTSRCR